ncbi:hypothetical protein OAD66_05320 [Bacteroidia bacterium]|nr:hypothetical protein [Bacteroidia bacterium]MDB9882535.1 hypothetical protein [Bacteroidia bacterium]
MALNKSSIWFIQIFKLSKKETLATLFPEMLMLTAFTFAVVYLELNYFEKLHHLENAVSVF